MTLSMTDERRVAQHARRIALELAIADRWSYRSWYRETARLMFGDRWRDLEAANAVEIRRLVAQLRRERGR